MKTAESSELDDKDYWPRNQAKNTTYIYIEIDAYLNC